MKYEQFRTIIDEHEKNALDLVFSFSGNFYEDRFSSCFALAEEIINIAEDDIEKVVALLKKVPASYISASLVIMRKLNKQKDNILIKIREELNKIYVEDFKAAISKKKCKFAMFDKLSVDNYINLKTRLVDDVEIIKITKALGIRVGDIIGEYSGDDSVTITLNKAMHRIRANSVQENLKAVMEKVVILSVEYVSKNIKSLNDLKAV